MDDTDFMFCSQNSFWNDCSGGGDTTYQASFVVVFFSYVKLLLTQLKDSCLDSVCSRDLRTCVSQMSVILVYFFNFSLILKTIPVLWNTFCLFSIPQKKSQKIGEIIA